MQRTAYQRARGTRHQIRKLAEEVSATVGLEFFQSMVRHLSAALGADCVYIGEFRPGQVERVRVLAASTVGETEDDFEFPLAGSAAAAAFLGKRSICHAHARSEFPDDEMVKRFAAESFVGIPLTGARQCLGILMALYGRGVRTFSSQTSMLEVFAPRAAAELRRRQSEERVRESEERYRTFVAANPDGLWRIELDRPIATDLPESEQAEQIWQQGYFAECNDAFARFHGRAKAADLIGCRLTDLADPDSDLSVRNGTLAAVRAGYRVVNAEGHLDTAGGERHYVLRSLWGIVEKGALQRIWGHTRDITQLRSSERELEASERRLSDLLEAIHLVVVILECDGAISFCNEYLLRLTGWTLDDVKGRNWFDLMIPEEQRGSLRSAMEAAKGECSAPIHLESTLLGPKGQRWWIAWDFTCLCDASGEKSSVVFVGRDATEYKELEAQFRQAQKLEGVGRLAGGVAHDFNNLLTVVLGYSGALLAGRDPADPAYTPLAEIRKAAEKGSELAHQLLAFSKRQLVHPSLMNLNTLIVEDERMLGRLLGENVELVVELTPGLGSIRADAGHIRQILMNLAINARDAMPSGGTLTISSSNIDTSQSRPPHCAGLPPGKYVLLTVADTGIGMTEEVRSHLFEPFFTTKSPGKGTGLGLSTVYGIIQESQAHIFVETKLKQGSTFRLFFPRVDGSPSKPEELAKAFLKGGSENILLVEDHYQVRVLTAKILRHLGYKVSEAEGADHALELAQHSGNRFDLLFSDIVMPRMGGIELAHRIESIQPGIKTLFMSGYADRAESGDDLADYAYIEKPFTPDQLGLKVREILDRS